MYYTVLWLLPWNVSMHMRCCSFDYDSHDIYNYIKRQEQRSPKPLALILVVRRNGPRDRPKSLLRCNRITLNSSTNSPNPQALHAYPDATKFATCFGGTSGNSQGM